MGLCLRCKTTLDSKRIECTTPRVNLHVNYGLWMIMMCQCRFISWNTCTTLVTGVDNGEGYACVGGWEHTGTFLYLPLNFAVHLKLF